VPNAKSKHCPILKNVTFSLLFLFLCPAKTIFAQQDGKAKPISVSGNVQVTNNGVAPVPIFALGRPAILSTTSIRKGRFYFNPEFNLGLDAKPWTLFSRIGYYLVEKKKLIIVLAANLNWFFADNNPVINNQEMQVQRYYSFEFNGQLKTTGHQNFFFAYWRSQLLGKLGVKFEDFANFVYDFEDLKLGDKNIFTFKPSVFYLYDYEFVKGFFAAQTSTYKRAAWKFNVFLTTSTPLGKLPGTGFVWNTGVNVPF
jgi:hypothetical protein